MEKVAASSQGYGKGSSAVKHPFLKAVRSSPAILKVQVRCSSLLTVTHPLFQTKVKSEIRSALQGRPESGYCIADPTRPCGERTEILAIRSESGVKDQRIQHKRDLAPITNPD